jgi:hypothetical protein
MSQEAFAASYGQIFRAIPYLPGSAEENVSKLWDLHHRHAQDVITIINSELRAKANIDAVLALPPNSLLAMVLSQITAQSSYIDPIEAEAPAPNQAAADSHDYSRHQMVFAVHRLSRKLLFEGSLEFGGAVFQLVDVLAEQFVADLHAGLPPQQYGFRTAAALAKRLRIKQQSLRQRISRARDQLEEAFLSTFGRQLDANDIIQNKGWNGYRLNPYLHLVNADQLKGGKK